jgi:hypothetical protein
MLPVASGAHFAWEHEQGRHQRPHMLCLICWLDKIAPRGFQWLYSGGAAGTGLTGAPAGVRVEYH